MDALPSVAAWRHLDAREGFEVVFLDVTPTGRRLRGSATAVEDGEPWAVNYRIDVDEAWITREVEVRSRARRGEVTRSLASDGRGRWQVDGSDAPELEGCRDIDFEASVCTNMLPVHRLGLAVGQAADAPAAFLRAVDLGVSRLEQHYERLEDDDGDRCFDYRAPSFDFRCTLRYDAAGLLLRYPGIAVRDRSAR